MFHMRNRSETFSARPHCRLCGDCTYAYSAVEWKALVIFNHRSKVQISVWNFWVPIETLMFFQSFCRPTPEVCLKLVRTAVFNITTDSPRICLAITWATVSWYASLGMALVARYLNVCEVFSKDCGKRNPRWEYNIKLLLQETDYSSKISQQ